MVHGREGALRPVYMGQERVRRMGAGCVRFMLQAQVLVQAYADASVDYMVDAPSEVTGDMTYTKSHSPLESSACK